MKRMNEKMLSMWQITTQLGVPYVCICVSVRVCLHVTFYIYMVCLFTAENNEKMCPFYFRYKIEAC